jgi:hypothetical protein
MHWLLDVEFKDDLSRYRSGHGAKNMAIVRRFALGLIRANKTSGSIKTRRKSASWNPRFVTGANFRANCLGLRWRRADQFGEGRDWDAGEAQARTDELIE